MKNKGLCINCVSNKDCSFRRQDPVLFCEEFDYERPSPQKIKRNKRKL